MATRALDPISPYRIVEHPRRAARSLWPREHGIYVQLLAPLLAALLIRPPAIAGVLIALAAGSAFLATEALLVARGGRGVRRQEIDGARAARRARLCGAIAIGAGGTGLMLAPRSSIELAGLVAVPAVLAIVLASRRAIHTLGGELVAAIALAGASAPVVAAAGISRADALALWLAWSLGFASTVFAVRGVLARQKRREIENRIDAEVAALAIAAMLVVASPLALVAMPLMLAGVVISLVHPSAKRMRTVGITLAVISAFSTLIAIAVV